MEKNSTTAELLVIIAGAALAILIQTYTKLPVLACYGVILIVTGLYGIFKQVKQNVRKHNRSRRASSKRKIIS